MNEVRLQPWNFPARCLRVLVFLLNCNSSFIFPCCLQPPVLSRMLDSLAKRCRLCQYHSSYSLLTHLQNSFQISYCFPYAAPTQPCTSIQILVLGRIFPQHSMITRLSREPILVQEMLLREQHAVPSLKISSIKPFSRELHAPHLVRNAIPLSQQGRQGTDRFLRTEQTLSHLVVKEQKLTLCVFITTVKHFTNSAV